MLKYYYKSIFGTVIVAHYSTFLYKRTQVQFIYSDTRWYVQQCREKGAPGIPGKKVHVTLFFSLVSHSLSYHRSLTISTLMIKSREKQGRVEEGLYIGREQRKFGGGKQDLLEWAGGTLMEAVQ